MISNDISDSILCFVKHYNSCLPIKCHCSYIKLDFIAKSTQVLYMSFDKLLLAVESRDLSQADKSIIRVSSFPKLDE